MSIIQGLGIGLGADTMVAQERHSQVFVPSKKLIKIK